METPERDELEMLIKGKPPDEAADIIIHLMNRQDVKILTLCHENFPDDVVSDALCQRIAEKTLKDILDIMKSTPVATTHMFVGCVLVLIKDIRIVKKYIWKDKKFLRAIESFLKFAKLSFHFVMLRDIAIHVIQALLLGGTPPSYFVSISNSEVLDLYADILQNKEVVMTHQSYEEISLSLIILCQNSKECLHKLHKLNLSDVLLKFSKWSKLDPNVKEKAEVASSCIKHMVNLDDMPDHKKLVLNKFTRHISIANECSKHLEKITCSNPACGTERSQNGDKEHDFKKCGRCRLVLYCSKKCQIAHWKASHSKICVAPSK